VIMSIDPDCRRYDFSSPRVGAICHSSQAGAQHHRSTCTHRSGKKEPPPRTVCLKLHHRSPQRELNRASFTLAGSPDSRTRRCSHHSHRGLLGVSVGPWLEAPKRSRDPSPIIAVDRVLYWLILPWPSSERECVRAAQDRYRELHPYP